MKIVVLILTVFFTANAFPAESELISGKREKRSQSSSSCPGGYSDGTQMDMGRYWYACTNGKIVPKGCLSDDGGRVDIGETFDTPKYRMQCVQNGDGYLSLIYKSCVQRGSAHDVSSQWDDGSAFYTCVQEGNNVRVVMLGCVDQGRPLKFDERVAKGDFVYVCKKDGDGSPKLRKVGCVFQGRKYNIGDKFDGSKSWFSCQEDGPQVVGCMHDSHRLEFNDRITREDTVFSCKVMQDSTDFVPFACIARDGGVMVEKKPGCFWVEGSGSEAYEYTCKEDGDKMSKMQTQCFYDGSRGGFKIQPGCIMLADDVAVGCHSNSGRLSLRTYSASQIDNISDLSRC